MAGPFAYSAFLKKEPTMESSGKTLQAYTRQHPQVLKTLEQTGVYRV